MERKVIALFLIFAMLATFSPAVAADEMSAKPTVEEIIIEYHQTAFADETGSDASSNSTWSNRSRNVSTLEQETVDTLTDVGYTAYHMSPDNYEVLEAELKTDFSNLGIDPNGEYIIVISGADQSAFDSPNSYSTFGSEPGQEEAPDGGGSTFFEYVYNGTTFYMRYLTITPTVSNGMTDSLTYAVQPNSFGGDTIKEIAKTFLVTVAEGVAGEAVGGTVPIGLVLSLLDDLYTDENFLELDSEAVTIQSDSFWTCKLLQIWTASSNCWDTAQCSEFVVSSATTSYLVDNPVTQQPERQYSDEYKNTHYSPKYYNESQKILDAIDHYDRVNSSISLDCIYTVDFYYSTEDNEVQWNNTTKPLFTHERSFSIPAHSFD